MAAFLNLVTCKNSHSINWVRKKTLAEVAVHYLIFIV